MLGRHAVRTVERYWTKIDKRGPDECWPWLGVRNTKIGHGRINIDGKLVVVSRLAWFLSHGKEPQFLVLHSCDNAWCCNPRHLFEGTQSDNMKDMYAKQRHKMWVGPLLCGHDLAHRSKGMCATCYQRVYERVWRAKHPEKAHEKYLRAKAKKLSMGIAGNPA